VAFQWVASSTKRPHRGRICRPSTPRKWVSCLPMALGCQLWEAENSVCRRFLGSSDPRQLTKIYAASITVTEQNCSPIKRRNYNL